MQGTPKQIDYANSIIDQIVKKMDKKIEENIDRLARDTAKLSVDDEWVKRLSDMIEMRKLIKIAVINYLNNYCTASMIIDNKSKSVLFYVDKIWRTKLAADVHQLGKKLNLLASDLDYIVKNW